MYGSISIMVAKKNLVIALDFDDVCIDFNSMFAEYNRIHHDTSYTREDIQEFDLSKLLECSSKEVTQRGHDFAHSKLHLTISPIQGAVEAIAHLRAQGVALHIVTARDKIIEAPTLQLIEKHFSPGFHGVHFLHQNDQKIIGEKGDVCARLRADFLIEDALHNALHHSMKSTHVLLFDTPWNQTDDLPKHVTRVHGWSHALEVIEKWLK